MAEKKNSIRDDNPKTIAASRANGEKRLMPGVGNGEEIAFIAR